ncbi:Hypothetical predicted protein [Podarcis lilfordi]|uniref:Uncharacterized protein n=1 Tax=Podarcis lilfordi TaxID=74358 RepID=A0AA35L0H8_9SAUR|nr:Hypothetical predicted protein [Podarcis lilfordi]
METRRVSRAADEVQGAARVKFQTPMEMTLAAPCTPSAAREVSARAAGFQGDSCKHNAGPSATGSEQGRFVPSGRRGAERGGGVNASFSCRPIHD